MPRGGFGGFLAGLFNALMGVICVLMSFGIKPDVEYMAVGLLGPQRYASSDASSGSDPGGRTQFMKAEAAWMQMKEQLSGKACRELWALHKQATEGDCRVPKPAGVFNGGEKEQWRLWMSLQGIPAEQAMAMFAERLQREEDSL
ncbi:unnamed protein product [Prorocentrum cordatum]|uniref:ACB domain-containing protein n=1 Tax=Prorocentrum cordatum TaxID=2364126 RepID=A0ABN9PF83_9DINO|nr:unnamed protein product [Polarella glacialis]